LVGNDAIRADLQRMKNGLSVLPVKAQAAVGQSPARGFSIVYVPGPIEYQLVSEKSRDPAIFIPLGYGLTLFEEVPVRSNPIGYGHFETDRKYSHRCLKCPVIRSPFADGHGSYSEQSAGVTVEVKLKITFVHNDKRFSVLVSYHGANIVSLCHDPIDLSFVVHTMAIIVVIDLLLGSGIYLSGGLSCSIHLIPQDHLSIPLIILKITHGLSVILLPRPARIFLPWTIGIRVTTRVIHLGSDARTNKR
jgi:hypothetical protein